MVSVKLLSLATLAGVAVAQNATIRYMPFGDSITEIICWRSKLWNKLQTTEWKNVDFVGSGKTENNCKDTKYDRDNEGHSGFLAINIANNKQLVGWLQKNPADVITMHLGTNDIVQQNKPVADIIKAFDTLIGVMRDSNPKMKIIVCSPLSSCIFSLVEPKNKEQPLLRPTS
jgi:lysophospholipase L1-like esterase